MNQTPEPKRTVAVLMTSFNRRQQTLRCLELLFTQAALPQVALRVILVDDGSSDGTPEAVAECFPAVTVLAGSGNLFWNQGMRMAFAYALHQGFDFYLWLNDDTQLFPGALETMLEAERALRGRGTPAIITGSTCDALTGRRSYGGCRWKAGWRRELEGVEPHSTEALPCDTMNGNCTLIPHEIAKAVGNLEPRFTHSFGDFDYGFRAVRAGFQIFTAPGFVGSCSDNSRRNTWRDRSASLRKRWQHLNSVKGSPFREWIVYCRRHLGLLWPLYAVSPYLKTVLTSLRPPARLRPGT
jgi:GT2 family glycosyltransferase